MEQEEQRHIQLQRQQHPQSTKSSPYNPPRDMIPLPPTQRRAVGPVRPPPRNQTKTVSIDPSAGHSNSTTAPPRPMVPVQNPPVPPPPTPVIPSPEPPPTPSYPTPPVSIAPSAAVPTQDRPVPSRPIPLPAADDLNNIPRPAPPPQPRPLPADNRQPANPPKQAPKACTRYDADAARLACEWTRAVELHPIVWSIWIVVMLFLCYKCCGCSCGRRDMRGEYRSLAASSLDEAFDDDYSLGENEDYLSDEDLEDYLPHTNGAHNGGGRRGGRRPKSNGVIQMSKLGKDAELTLEELNG